MATQPFGADTTTGTMPAPVEARITALAQAVADALTAADVDADATGAAAAAQAAAIAASQPLDSDLTAIAALTTTTFGRALLALVDAAAGRTALGLGTAATQATSAFDASGAAASTQAYAIDRAHHTGSQTSATISDFVEAAQDAVAAALAGATGATVTYDDAANTITITGIGDPETMRDTIGAALVGVGVITVTVDDAGNTITISSTATANSTDAALRDRSTHTGNQAESTVTGLVADLAAKAPLASPAFTGTPTGITKTHIGLANVDNTSDANKPVSTAQQTALDAKSDKASALNAQTGTTYTLVLTDADKVVTGSNASAQTYTVPPNSAVAFPIGTYLEVIQLGAGQITLAPGAGVTLASRGAALKLNAQYATAGLRKVATDTWVVVGDVTA